ncbi:MAG: zinc-binding alcohol dehydrogenase family protein [Tahibacter sp.]
MRAIAVTQFLPTSDPRSMVDIELPVPAPGPRDLRVRVEAVSVNPVDTKVRSRAGSMPGDPRVLGYDAAGVVDAVGTDVSGFQPGDRVFYSGSIVRSGTNAQFHLVDERIVARMPQTLDFAQAAALPLTAITAWELLFERIGLDPDGASRGKSILVLGAAGGVGSILLQLSRRAGLVTIATASRAESRAHAIAHGAAHMIDHSQPLLAQLQALGFDGVDVVANLVDTDGYWDQCAEVVKPQGRIGLIVGSKTALPLEPLKNKSVGVAWEMMFTRSEYQTPDMDQQGRLLARVADLVDRGELQSTLTETLTPINAANLRLAHARSESGRTLGKLVIAGWNS